MSPKQRAAIQYIAANPRSTPDEIAGAVDVKGGMDNRAAFIWRLLSSHSDLVFITVGIDYEGVPS